MDHAEAIDRTSRVQRTDKAWDHARSDHARSDHALAARLRDCESRLDALCRSQPVVELDLDGATRWANEPFLAMTGYALREVEGVHHREFHDADFVARGGYARLWADLRAGLGALGEFALRTRDGGSVWVLASYSVAFDDGGRAARVLVHAFDISSLRAVIVETHRNAAALASSSRGLSRVSRQMSGNAQETTARAESVAAAAREVDTNMQTVSEVVGEVLANLREIDRSASEATRVAADAVTASRAANEMVVGLGARGDDIRQFAKAIASIAEQSHLLALNATLEAARAGLAGRGFAVVAGEVKALARETARVTEDIVQRIEAIRSCTRDAAGAIAHIGDVLRRVETLQCAIARSVQFQTGATSAITSSVEITTRKCGEIAATITAVARAAQDTQSGAVSTERSALALAEMAADLQGLAARAG